MKPNSVYILPLILCMSFFGKASSQAMLSDKVVSYIYFIENEELLMEVLNQTNIATKSKKCSVVVTDSVFSKRSDVKAKTVKESFDVIYNSNGQPTKLSYDFNSNKVSFSAEVPFVYSGPSTYIVAPTQIRGPIPVALTTTYLYQTSPDGSYTSRTLWLNTQDTTLDANSREWSIKNNQNLDSISEVSYGFGKIRSMMVSNIRSAGKSVCKFKSETDIEDLKNEIEKEEQLIEYSFNASGRLINKLIIEDGGETSSESWTYDAENRLTGHTTIIKSPDGRDTYKTSIIRDSNGNPTIVHLVSPKQSLRFDFSWK